MELGALGSFVRILWLGFAPLLTLIFNAVLVVRNVLTLGLWPAQFSQELCAADVLREVAITVTVWFALRYLWQRFNIAKKLHPVGREI